MTEITGLPKKDEGFSRLDKILYALCSMSNFEEIEVPQSRIEEYYYSLITTNTFNLPIPQSRVEHLLNLIIKGEDLGVEVPQSRIEYLLYVLAELMPKEELPFVVTEASSRHERYLWYLIENGGMNLELLTIEFYESETIYNTKDAQVRECEIDGSTILSIEKTKVGTEEFDVITSIASIGTPSDTKMKIEDDVYKSAILSGQTKYRDTETGDILDSFDNTKKLELISVKMPVLTTRGKNLFDGKLEKGSINIDGKLENSSTMQRSVNFIKVKPNTYYTTSNSLNEYNGIRAYDENKTFISNLDVKPTFITPINCEWIKLTTTTIESVEIQIEEGETKTPYEPYKTNILSTPSDLVLGSVGNVTDTLDLMTGDVVERTTDIIINGTENIVLNRATSDFTVWEFPTTLSVKDYTAGKPNAVCDKLVVEMFASFDAKSYEFICITPTKTYIKLSASKGTTVQEVKAWLSNNNLKLKCAKAQEVIKTVDLNYQRVYSYDGVTHYFCSSGSEAQSLIPTLSIDVPTNLTALVSRQRATVEAQNEQIQILEVENEILIEQNEMQNLDIELNQGAINFILFAPQTLSTINIDNEDKGVHEMAAYLANQILKGKLDYTLVVSRYGEFKEDIDTILISEGKQDLIK